MNPIDSSSSKHQQRPGEPSRYRDLFRMLGVPVLVLDPDEGSIIEANNQAAELFGYSRDELAGMDLDAVSSDLGAHARDRTRDTVDHAAKTGPFSVERRARDADGNDFWIEASLQPFSGDDRTEVIATIRNVSERAKRDRDRRSFRTAVENAGHSIYWTDIDGTIEYANPAFERITGYDREEIVGENPRMLQSGEMGEDYYRDLWETILAGETFEREVINESKDGEQFVVSQTVAPITGPTGEIERFVAVNSDITDRKRREERIKAEKERVQQLHERLSVMNRILRHDIRSSVNIIKGNAELADSSGRQPDRALETVIDEADRLQRIAESVRHIETAIGDTEAGLTDVDVATLVQTKVLKYQNEFPDVDFETELPDSAIAEAREQFDLALDHLFSNAIEHHDGENPTVEVEVSQNDGTGTVDIVITDDGPGIPEDELKPLQKREETPLEHTSGLGLWLTQWVVEVSNGELAFETSEERGTSVRIELESPA